VLGNIFVDRIETAISSLEEAKKKSGNCDCYCPGDNDLEVGGHFWNRIYRLHRIDEMIAANIYKFSGAVGVVQVRVDEENTKLKRQLEILEGKLEKAVRDAAEGKAAEIERLRGEEVRINREIETENQKLSLVQATLLKWKQVEAILKNHGKTTPQKVAAITEIDGALFSDCTVQTFFTWKNNVPTTIQALTEDKNAAKAQIGILKTDLVRVTGALEVATASSPETSELEAQIRDKQNEIAALCATVRYNGVDYTLKSDGDLKLNGVTVSLVGPDKDWIFSAPVKSSMSTDRCLAVKEYATWNFDHGLGLCTFGAVGRDQDLLHRLYQVECWPRCGDAAVDQDNIGASCCA
jgi:DNA-binding protein YbaB